MAAVFALVLGVCALAGAQSGTSVMSPTVPAGSMAPPPSNGPRPTTGTGIVIGRVIDMSTGQPVAGAVVTIGSASLSATITNYSGGPTVTTNTPGALDGSTRTSDLRVLTDTQGRFAFLDLPPGSFQFGVAATGYIGGGYGQRRPTGAPQPFELTDDQHVTDLTLPLWKYGAVSGTVTDEAGDPVVNIPITLLRWQSLAGRRRLAPSGQSGTTDDRGVYRIGLLIPGEYVVVAAVSQRTMPLAVIDEVRSTPPGQLPTSLARSADPNVLPGSAAAIATGNAVMALPRGAVAPVPSGRMLMYQTVFYPASRSPADATPVKIASGEERGNVDVQLRLVPTMRVSGVVSGPEGPIPHLTLRLFPAGMDEVNSDSGFDTTSTMSDADGAFSFVGVAPGQYVVRAFQGPPAGRATGSGPVVISGPQPLPTPTGPYLYANQALTVGEDEVNNLPVMLRAGARVGGTLQFDGTKERPAADVFKNINMTPQAADGRAVSVVVSAPTRSPFDATGQATSGGLAPGRYVFTASGAPAGWTFKAALYNGRDIAATPLDVETSDINGVVFVFTDRTSEIAGTVQNAAGTNDGDATVLLFPVDPKLWTDGGTNPPRLKTMRVTKTGAFRLAPLPEGEYFVVAVRDENVSDWPDPKFLDTLRASATRVQIVEGDRKTVNLRTVR